MPRHRNSFLPPALIVVALFTGVGHALAWEEIGGNWCKSEGCTSWHSLYRVKIEPQHGRLDIEIHYRHTPFRIFKGEIEERKEKEYVVSGIYTPPPLLAGCAKDEASRGQRAEAIDNGLAGAARGAARWRTADQKRAQDKAGRMARAGSAVARKAVGSAQPVDKYDRRVSGNISSDKDKITIDLPATPVLDYRCALKEISAPGPLVLVRQESVHVKEPASTDPPQRDQGAAQQQGPQSAQPRAKSAQSGTDPPQQDQQSAPPRAKSGQ